MISKSLKYLAIAIANLTVLIGLLALWTDRLELIFSDAIRPRELLKILGFTFLSLIGMRLLVFYFRKKSISSIKSKIIIASTLTFLISSYLYIDYSQKVIKNKLVNGQFRRQIANKIKPSHVLAYGSMAENLTFLEYQQIVRMSWFPIISNKATNINYIYGYDGFLPDYIFTLKYDLPKSIFVDTLNYQKGDFSRRQTVETLDNFKRITYSEAGR